MNCLINTWGFSVKTWMLIACDTAFYAIMNFNAIFGSCSNEGKGECDVFPHPNMEIMERRVRRGRTCRHRHGRPVTDCFITLGTLTLNALIATKVVCFSRLLKCLRSLYGKQCGPRSDCSCGSSLFWAHAVCFYT